MPIKINSNLKSEAKKLGKMSTDGAHSLAIDHLKRVMTGYIPIFANATPKKTGAAAKSIKVVEDQDSIRMQWGTDYIDDVNRASEKSQGFADKQFDSVVNRIDIQAKKEIASAYKQQAKKNKLKVKS